MNFTPGVGMYELDSSSELISTKGDLSASPPITPHATMEASSSSSFLPESPDEQLWTVPGTMLIDYTHIQHSPPSSPSLSATSPQRPIQVMGSYLSPSRGIESSSLNENDGNMEGKNVKYTGTSKPKKAVKTKGKGSAKKKIQRQELKDKMQQQKNQAKDRAEFLLKNTNHNIEIIRGRFKCKLCNQIH